MIRIYKRKIYTLTLHIIQFILLDHNENSPQSEFPSLCSHFIFSVVLLCCYYCFISNWQKWKYLLFFNHDNPWAESIDTESIYRACWIMKMINSLFFFFLKWYLINKMSCFSLGFDIFYVFSMDYELDEITEHVIKNMI